MYSMKRQWILVCIENILIPHLLADIVGVTVNRNWSEMGRKGLVASKPFGTSWNLDLYETSLRM